MVAFRSSRISRQSFSFAAAICRANNRMSRIADKMKLLLREKKKKEREGDERKSTRGLISFLLQLRSLVAFGKVVKTVAKTVGNSQSRPSALLNYETSYRTRADAQGIGRLPAIYFANCKSWSGQVPFRFLSCSSRVVVDPEMSCAPYAASCRAHNSPTAAIINGIPNMMHN